MIHIPLIKPNLVGGTTLKDGLVSVWEFNEDGFDGRSVIYDAHSDCDGTNYGGTQNQSSPANLGSSYFFDGEFVNYANLGFPALWDDVNTKATFSF
jgi:hypothetical protein